MQSSTLIEERFKKFFNDSLIGCYISTPEGQLIDCNQAFIDMMSYPDKKTALSVNTYNTYIKKKDRDYKIDQLRNRKKLIHYKEEVVKYDGTKFIALSNLWGEYNDDGELEFIQGYTQDISKLMEIDKSLIESEEKLRENEQRLTLHIEHTPLGVIDWDTNFLVKEWNNSAEKIFGYTRKEALGKHPKDLILTDDVIPLVDDIWSGLLKQKGGRRSTNDNVTKDGRLITCEWYNTPLIDNNGTVIGVASLVQDITKRVEVEKELKESEKKFRSIIENIELLGIMLDENANIIYANDYLLKKTGWKRKEIMGKNWFDLFIGEDIKNEIKDIFKETVQANNITTSYLNEIKTKTGDKLIINWSNTAQYDTSGKVESITSIGEDVTQQLIAERDLKESEEKFRSIIENIQLLGVMLDEKANIIFANDYLLKKTGWKKKEVLNKNYFDIFVSKDYRERSQRRFNEILKSKAIFSNRTNEVLTKKGERLIVEWSVTVQYDENGKLIAATSIGQDITKQKQAEADLSFQSELIKQSHESIITTDLDFRISWVNQAFTDLFGYNKKEVLGKTPDLLNAEPLAEDIQNEIYSTMNKGEVYRGIHLNKRKNGSQFYCDMWIFPVRNMSGDIIAYSGHQLDITDEIETQNALITSEARFRSIFESVAEGVILVDKKGRVLYANNALCKLAAVDSADIIGKSALSLAKKMIDVKQLPATIKAVEGAMRGKQFKPYDIEVNNKILEVSITFNKLNRNIVGVLRDITEFKQATDKVNEYRDHLEDLVEQRTLELKEKNAELDNALKVFVGREITIKNLRNEIEDLKQKINEE